MKSFSAKILKIGINPYVLVPPEVLEYIFGKAGKDKGQIPITIKLNRKAFPQTLVRYSGKWRLYLNTPMRQHVSKDVGDEINIAVDYDANDRTVPIHPQLALAFKQNKKAKDIFDKLPASRQKEISRYLHNLKSKEAIEKNVVRALGFLLGEERFIGRDGPN